MSEHHQVTDTPERGEVASTWDKLRRRKVVQWGIVYAAGAWGLLQGLSYISVTFDWPRQIQQVTTLALLVGLPIVLVLAWYHGDRGEQRVSRAELTIITLLFLVGGGIFWRYQGASETRPAATPAAVAPVAASAPATTTADTRPSIAVLPFENLSGDPDNAYFVSGMQDLILTNLSKIRGIKVISRTSTEKYASHPDNLKTVGAELGVANILEGSVQRAGDHVLINVQLIDANTDTHLWAEVYNRKIEDVFAVEQEVAKTVAEALQATLSPAESAAIAARPTDDPVAYDLFLRAQYAFQHGSQNQELEALVQAIALYRQAIAEDPRFALAEAKLSIALSDLYWNGGTRDLSPRLLDQQSREAMAAARRLQPDLPEGNLALAFVKYRLDLDYPAALEAFDAVLAARPGESYALYGKALPLRRLGRFQEAIAALEAAAVVSPRDSDVAGELAVTRWMVRRAAEAEAGLRHALALDPANGPAAANLSALRVYRDGDLADAWAVLHGDRPQIVLQRVQLLRYQRKHAEALRLLATIPDDVLADIAAGTPREYLSGRLYFEAGRRAEAEPLLRKARADLQAVLGSLPANYARGESVRLALADTEAMLGDEAAALRTAEQALVRQPIEKDAVNGPFALAQAAQVHARLGRADLVLPALERLRLLPGADQIVSASTLKLDPTWDEVRTDPGFQEEIRRFAEFDRP